MRGEYFLSANTKFLSKEKPQREKNRNREQVIKLTFLLYVNVLSELNQLSHIVIRQFLMTQISVSIDNSGSLEMNRISLKSSPEAIFK